MSMARKKTVRRRRSHKRKTENAGSNTGSRSNGHVRAERYRHETDEAYHKIRMADLATTLPQGWRITAKRDFRSIFNDRLDRFDEIDIATPSGNELTLRYDEHPTYIEIHSISAERERTGDGTRLMNAVKEYADQTGRGVAVRDVSNTWFFDTFDWLERSPDPLSDFGANPNYTYRVDWHDLQPLIEMPEGDWWE